MNKINWEVRIKSKTFWLAAVPAFLLLVQTIGVPFGYKWDFVVLNQQLAAIINAAFGLLAIIGVVVDPTTAGIKDSQRVMEKMEDNK
nr:MAG TPA: holin [Caudoviricetes sp.]